MLYGSFIELWDDHVAGLWAEMLNDRSFAGVQPRVNWCYHIGEPNVCDRKWDANDTWTMDSSNPFNGAYSAKLTSAKGKSGLISQSGLAMKKGMTYHFSGYFRTNSPAVKARMVLKTLLPDETWMVLASTVIPNKGDKWNKFSCDVVSKGTTDKAVFEIVTSGAGCLYVDKLSLMPANNVRGWRKDIVEAIKDMKTPVIRWGGCVIDPGDYRWKECTGDRDLRVPFPNNYWGRIDPNDVGIDEFLQLCEAVGAQPIVCISFTDGAESANHLVHYCNDAADTEWGKKRAANGHPKPYGVKHWQIGNELEDTMYVNGVLGICKAIKNADKDAIILASFPSEDLMDKVGSYVDYVCPHYYRDDFDNIESEIKQISELIKKKSPNHKIGIGVTEWNVTNPWGFMRGKILTLEFGLFNARFLNIFHRNSEFVQIACRSNMCNSLGDGAIQTNAATLYKTPGYHVLKLYNEHTKPIPVVLTGIPEGFDMTACATEDRSKLCIFVTNMKEEPVELNLNLDDYGKGFVPVGGDVVCDTQDQRQLDVMNHWSAPDRIRGIKLQVSDGKVILPAFSVSAIECQVQQ